MERLGSPEDLGNWLRAADLIADDAVPTSADYSRAIELRESLARIAGALVDGKTPADADRDSLNAAARAGMLGAYELDGELRAQALAERPIDFALGRIALDAIEIFARRRERLTRCELHDCGGLFVTSVRGERRRWCSMETCGNRAKVAAHRARRRAEARAQ